MFGGSSNPVAYQSIGFGATTDGVYLPRVRRRRRFAASDRIPSVCAARSTTTAIGSRAAASTDHSAVRYDGTAKAFICANFTTPAKAVSADYVCNPDFNVSQLGVVTRWTPVKNLTFSAKSSGSTSIRSSCTAVRTVGPSRPRSTFKDQDTVHLQLRVQRNF